MEQQAIYMADNLNDKVGFAIGTGRCGTNFISRLLSLEKDVSACHERNPENEAFHRYCKWNKLKVDNTGFIFQKITEIQNDLVKNTFSFESSPHLSLSVWDLWLAIKPKFILLIREPSAMIKSYHKKGIYKDHVIRNNHHLPIGYQNLGGMHRFLGRIVPTGEMYNDWAKLSQYGKLAWWWRVINELVLLQFELIPFENRRIYSIENLDYAEYKNLVYYMLQKSTRVTESRFQEIVASKPNTLNPIDKSITWNEYDKELLMKFVDPLAHYLGYDGILMKNTSPKNSNSMTLDWSKLNLPSFIDRDILTSIRSSQQPIK